MCFLIDYLAQFLKFLTQFLLSSTWELEKKPFTLELTKIWYELHWAPFHRLLKTRYFSIILESATSQADPMDQVPSTKEHLGLDDFLARVTSEDNASFEGIMEESDKRHRRKFPWLYEEDSSKKFIKAPPVSAITHVAGGVQLALEDVRMNSVATWDYKARNSVMQNPEGVAFTPAEQEARDQQRIVVRHEKTRFGHDPWKNIEVSVDKSAEMALGKIGPDGLEILPSTTPRVNGYAFMPSPSPVPGAWEGTSNKIFLPL